MREYAQQQRYAFVGAAEVTLAEDDSLGTGVFRIRSEVRPGRAAGCRRSRSTSAVSRTSRSTGITYPLHAVTRLGRGTDVDIRIDDPGSPGTTPRSSSAPTSPCATSDSTNGTLVNGRLVPSAVLTDGAGSSSAPPPLTYRAR